MSLLAIGINHTTAPVGIREQVAITDSHIPNALEKLIHVPSVSEAAIISTCNRTELYCQVESHEQGRNNAIQWLTDFHQLAPEDAEPYLYNYLDQEVVRHAFRVASGLDSMVLGEPQILGQFKDAYQRANQAGTLGKQLNQLFQQAFNVAKKVRTHTSIGANPVSVASTAVTLAKQIFGDLSHSQALLIGAGETIELTAQHIRSAGSEKIVIANRSVDRAQAIAEQYNGQGIGLTHISHTLPECDIVITATASPLPILGKGLLERCIKQRKHKPIFIVDLAVPRDVEPEAGELSDVYLYTVDDLHDVIEENLSARQQASEQAETIINDEVERFQLWQRDQTAVQIISQYRDQAEQYKQEVLQKAIRQIEQGKAPEEVMQFLANGLTNKLLHSPTEALKSINRKEQRQLLDAAKIIFNLKDL